jgi:hypothetical protein
MGSTTNRIPVNRRLEYFHWKISKNGPGNDEKRYCFRSPSETSTLIKAGCQLPITERKLSTEKDTCRLNLCPRKERREKRNLASMGGLWKDCYSETHKHTP